MTGDCERAAGFGKRFSRLMVLAVLLAGMTHLGAAQFPATEAMLLHFNKLIAVAWILIVSVMYKNRSRGAANPIRN